MARREKILRDLKAEVPHVIKVNGEVYQRAAFATSREELNDRKQDIIRHRPNTKFKVETVKYYIGHAPSSETNNEMKQGHSGRVGLAYVLYQKEGTVEKRPDKRGKV